MENASTAKILMKASKFQNKLLDDIYYSMDEMLTHEPQEIMDSAYVIVCLKMLQTVAEDFYSEVQNDIIYEEQTNSEQIMPTVLDDDMFDYFMSLFNIASEFTDVFLSQDVMNNSLDEESIKDFLCYEWAEYTKKRL